MLICPVCRRPLRRDASAWRCSKGHSFDRAASGYVHLLPADARHSRLPGDSKEMVAARRAFLSSGGYDRLCEGVVQAVVSALGERAHPVVVDAGCGEGYYTHRLCTALAAREPQVYGFDLSKAALRTAAKRCPQGTFAVASLFRLPLADRCADGLMDIFAPVAADEFARVLRPGGWLFLVGPGPRHLFGLKQVLYQTPYENPEEERKLPGFTAVDRLLLRDRITLRGEQIGNLFAMTPYFWRTPREGAARLTACETLQTEVEFVVDRLRREG